MMRTLLWKELRGGWLCALPFALLMSATVVSVLFDSKDPLLSRLDFFPQARRLAWHILMSLDMVAYVAFSSMGLGVLLGVAQTVPESVVGTAPFFAHVVGRRGRILTAKIAIAMALFAATVLVPVGIIVAAFLAWGGPAGWSQLWKVSLNFAAGVTLYFVVLAIGIRGVPWKEWVSKAGACFVVTASVFGALQNPDSPVAVSIMAVGAIVSAAWAVTGSATREF